MRELDFYKDKRVFVTGHTGFKGSWLCELLSMLGAEVTGFALEPPTEPSMFRLINSGQTENEIKSVIGDVRRFEELKRAFDAARPEIVFHLAAQPIVRVGYENPVFTYETNVMGTVNLLECVREAGYVRSVVNVTTDKVYFNDERGSGYRENDTLCGRDPYSNSKSCSELVTFCYGNSFFDNSKTAVSTARAGNVIGGGDFARDRIIPDCVRAAAENRVIIVRNPRSVRPYQHVLEPLSAYLLIAARQYDDPELAGCYNVGPDESGCVTTGELADMFCGCWQGALWENVSEENAPSEASFLRLDSSRIRNALGWAPRKEIKWAVEKTAEWSRAYLDGKDVREVTRRQIDEYFGGLKCLKI